MEGRKDKRGRKGIWANRLDEVQKLIGRGYTLEEIGANFNVSKQRMYQVFTKYGINTLLKKKQNFLRDKPPKYFWFNQMLRNKGFSKKDRLHLLETYPLPRRCPVLGMELNYDGTGQEGYSRGENSPSIDRIDSSKGYTVANICVISWRANRIKNDGTPDEHLKIYNYFKNLT